MANTRAVIDIDINTSGAASALKSLQSQINAFTTALNKNNAEQALASRGISRQLMDLVNISRFFTAEMTKMQTGAAQLDKTLSKGQVTMGQFFSQKFRKDGLAAAQVLSLANARASALQTQFVATAGAAGGMREALAIRPLQAFNTEAAVTAQRLAIQRAMLQQATTSMINFGKNTQWAGRQLMVGFTVPMTIFAATAGKAFMEIDKELTNFKKVYGDAMTPPAELEQNLSAVKGLAKEFTKYGIAVKDTIGLAAQAAAAGAQNAELIDATTQSTRLATLGQMEQNQALETTISLQNAFKLSGDELAKSINFLNMVENQTVVTLQDLSAAIPRVAPVIKGLGGSVEDLAAMLAAMQEGGVTAEQGANALKSGLASLINPTNRASEGLEKVGINLNAIINTNRGDLMGTVQDFANALDTLDKFSRQQALEQVFGKFQYARLGALFDNINKDGTQAARVLDLANMSAQQLAASAEKELGAIEQSVSVKFTAAMEKIKADIAPIGELFLKMATPVINFLSSVIEKFNSLPDFAKNFAAFGAVIVGVVIPAGTMFLGLLMNLVGTLTKFGHLSTIFVKGFASGGITKAISNVTQAVSYMSLSEIDATLAAEQLSGATNAVNAALLDQVAASEPATAAVLELAAAYDILAQNMRESAAAAPVVLGPAGQAMRRGSGSIVGRPLPIVARNKGGSIPYLSGGGRPTVPGMGTKDTVPAMLTPGEFVVNKKATEQNMALLHAINDGDVQYRNMGGGIAKPGRKYYGIKPNSLSMHTQRAKERLAAFESSRSDIAGIFGVSPTVRRAPVMRAQQSTKVAGSRSADIYNALKGKSTANVDLLRTAVGLGISPEELGLKKLGNLIVGTSKSTNMLMATGNLSKSQLLGDVSGAKSLSPISAQLERYFGSRLDEKVFRRLYLEEIDKLPSQGITNKRFEKATRNALRRYLDESGYNKNQRNSFIRDILEGDTIRSGASLSRVKQALDSNGISYTQEDGKLWATVNGKTYDFARLTGKKIDNLGRAEGIIRYDKIPMEEGLARAHANKGGMIPGVQYFGSTMLNRVVQRSMPTAQRKKMIGSLGEYVQQYSPRGTTKSGRRRFRVTGFDISLVDDALRMSGMSEKEIAKIPLYTKQRMSQVEAAHIKGKTPWENLKNLVASPKMENQSLRNMLLFDIDTSNMNPRSIAYRKKEAAREAARKIVKRNPKMKDVSDRILSGVHPTDKLEIMFVEKLSRELMDNPLFNRDRLYIRGLNGMMKIRLSKKRKDDPLGLFTSKKVTLADIQNKNKGGMIQYFGRGGWAQPTEFMKNAMRRRAQVSVAKGKNIEDIIFSRGEDGKLNADPSDLLYLLRENPNLTEKQIEQIAKYHGRRTRDGMFGKANDPNGFLWKNLSLVLRDKGYPVLRPRKKPQGFNSGGFISPTVTGNRNIVPGAGNRDTVPAMLTPGEFVINKKATQQNLPLLHAINGGKVNNYSMGGMAKGIQEFALGGLVRGVSAAGGGLWQYTDLTGQRVLAGSLEEANKAQRQVNREITRAQRENNRRQRQQSRSRSTGMGRGFGLSMGIGAAGGALMSAQMIPGVAENAGLSGAMQAGGMALSMASILPMIPGAMNPYVLAVGAAAAVTAGSLYAWRKSVDENAKKSAELGAAVGGTANSLNVMAKVLGTQTPAMAQATQTLNIAADDMAQFEEIGTYLQGQAGQEFLSRFEGKTTAQRTTELTDYITQAVAAGMMDNASAELFAKAVGQSLGDVATGSAAAANIKDAKAGIDAMLDLADKRLSAVEKTAAISEVAKAPEVGDFGFQKSIATEASAFAIGSALQVVQDYSNVIAQARNEYENGTISHRKYIEVLNKATSAQDEYASVISKSVANAVDMQGARQALDAQLIAGGMTQEQVDAITSSTDIGVSGAIQLPFLGGGQGGQSAYISDYLSRATEGTFSYDMANADELIAEAQRAQDAASKMFENGLNEDLKTMVASGKIAADQAAALGRELMNNSLSAAAQQYQKMQEEGKSLLGLDQAVFMQNIESGIIAGLDDIQEQKIIDIGVRYSETGGNLAELTASLNNLPDDKRLNFITSLSGDIDEELLDILLKGSAEALTTKVSLFAAGLDSGYRSDVSASGLAKDVVVNRALGTTANVETTNRQEANRANALMNSSDAQRRQNLGIDKLKQQSEEYITAFDKIAEMAGAEAAIAIDTQLKFNGNQEDLPRVIDGIKEYEENIKNLTDLPKDISVRLNVDYSDPDQVNNLGPLAETIKTNWPILQNLNKSIDLKLYSEFLLTNGRGEELSAKEIFANTKELNRLENTFKNAKNSTVRKQAFLELIQRKNGKLDDAGIDQAGDIWQDMINKFGDGVVTKAKPSVLIKYYDLQVELRGLKESKKKLEKYIKAAAATGDSRAAVRAQDALDAVNEAIGVAGEKIARSEADVYGSSMGPSTTGGGGGGGGGEKSIIQQLKEQLKTLENIYEGFAKNINQKTGLYKDAVAGPFGKQFIDYLISQGEKGIKILKEKGDKFNQAYKLFVANQMQTAKNYMQTLPSLFNEQRLDTAGKTLIEDRLMKQNIGKENIESIIGGLPEGLASAYAKASARKSRGKNLSEEQQNILGMFSPRNMAATVKQINKMNAQSRSQFINTREDALELRDTLEDALAGKGISPEVINMLQEMGWTTNQVKSNMSQVVSEAQKLDSIVVGEKLATSMSDMANETNNLQYALELMASGVGAEAAMAISQIGNAATLSSSQVQNFANAFEDLKILRLAVQDPAELALQKLQADERVNQLKYEIELIEEINKDEAMSALYAKEKVSNHEDLLKVYQRQADAKSREIELEQRKLEPIDEQIEKLEDQKTKIEEEYDKRLETLDEILSREEEIFAIRERTLDVADALSRGDIAEAAKAALELEKERASQRSDDQRSLLEKQRQLEIEAVDKNINALKTQREAIENNIKRLQLEQRAIQDQIYNVQVIINDQAARLEEKYKLGNNQLAILKAELAAALVAQNDLNAAIERQNALRNTPAPAPSPPPPSSGGTSAPSAPQPMILPGFGIVAVPSPAPAPKPTPKGYTTLPGFGITVPVYSNGGSVKYKGSTERAPGFANGGRIPQYFANGGRPFGSDSVPAMLTPGEFVVRRSAAKAYGPLLENINSNVFPRANFNGAMPKGSAKDSGSMYNYNVNVTLNGSNMDPDDVANAVMQKIKMKESMNVRSYNYRG